MTFDDARSYLLSLGHETLTIKLGLKNTEILLSALNNPHQDFPAVQIAGTNGKGSTAVTLASICRAAQIRTGLFTSPHLVSITERIQIDGQAISESDFARHTSQVRETANQLVRSGELETLPTFFEHITAIALLAFREAKVDLVILETGLGGRLDSTTAAGAKIVAITPIALDHQEHLGNTLSQIAAEKAAIIRPGVNAIVAPQAPEALEIIRRRAETAGVVPQPSARSHVLDSSSDGRFRVTFETERATYAVRLGLRGRHQIANVATAIVLAEAPRAGGEISRQAILDGIEATRHPGRLEFWDSEPRILFDGAHNAAAARALRDYLDEFMNQPITMIFGAMRDKQLDEMAAILFPSATHLVLTELDNPRAATAEMLSQAVPKQLENVAISRAASVAEALKIARDITTGSGVICVTGSLYLVGAVQEFLRSERCIAGNSASL